MTAPAAPTAQPLVELREVARTFGGASPVEAVRPTDLRIHAGEFVSISGPSGSGKSTLLNLLGLLDRPTAGQYLLRGRDVARLPEKARTRERSRTIGFVFQSFHLLDGRSTTENVALPLLYQQVTRPQRIAAAGRCLRQVGLGHRARAGTETLSGGERQRVAIARAMVTGPAMLLCDEPTGNLDSASSAAVVDQLEELNSLGVTVVLVTHDPALAARAARQLHVHDGVVTEPAAS